MKPITIFKVTANSEGIFVVDNQNQLWFLAPAPMKLSTDENIPKHWKKIPLPLEDEDT